ncbi:MAG: DNA methyltransferase, partial [Dongiaceae bacterium]
MTAPLETYLAELRRLRLTGVATDETSYYPPLQNLLSELGRTLKPKVFCLSQPKDAGAGRPDFQLYTAGQLPKAAGRKPVPDMPPERGVIEVKGTGASVSARVDSRQVIDYWTHYGLILVTNYWDFALLGADRRGERAILETFRLADSEEAFWSLAAHPRAAAKELNTRFVEFLTRVLLHRAPLAQPKDVAWFLASYARDALARVEAAGDLPALAAVRGSLEEALGLKFEGEKGEHFFRSTLVQTLFYGVFSAWVTWCRQQAPGAREGFDWHTAAWTLHVPMVRTLFTAVATPERLGPLGLVEVLNWTAAALNRVDRAAFFARFQEERAVQYFYEPFLEAFDP